MIIINPGTLWKIFQCTVIQSSWNFQFSKNIFQSDKTASLLWRFILQRGNRSLICFIQTFIGGWGHAHQITNQVYINILWIAYSILAINYSFSIWIVLCILYLYRELNFHLQGDYWSKNGQYHDDPTLLFLSPRPAEICIYSAITLLHVKPCRYDIR